MMDRLIDVLCGLMRSSLHGMAHHWFLTIIGVVLLVVLSPLLIRVVYCDLGYLLWRLTGGLGHALQCSHAKNLQELFGLSNPHPSSVETKNRFLMNLTTEPQSSTSDFIVLGENATLYRPQSVSPELKTVEVKFENFFPVNPNHLRRGCHGKYSLAKSLYLGRTISGDPRCGGGLKYFTAPLWQRLIEYRGLRQLLEKKVVDAYVWQSKQSGANGIFYHKTWDEKVPLGYLTFLVGDDTMIKEYARRREMVIKPIQLVFA